MSKETKKALKKEQKKSKELRPLLDEIVSTHELGSMDELMEFIRSGTLEPDEEVMETFEEYNPNEMLVRISQWNMEQCISVSNTSKIVSCL